MFQVIEQSATILNPTNAFDEISQLKAIELAARTCYKSESRITEDSAKKLITDRLRNANQIKEHGTTFEHGFVIFEVSERVHREWKDFPFVRVSSDNKILMSMNFRTARTLTRLYPKSIIAQWFVDYSATLFDDITVRRPNGWWASDLNKHIRLYECPLTQLEKDIHNRISIRFVTNRGISHELVRHRVMSINQESTRYVRYISLETQKAQEDANKKHIKPPMTYIRPVWADEWVLGTYHEEDFSNGGLIRADLMTVGNTPERIWMSALWSSTVDYENLINQGWGAQKAREVLNNALKTELVITGNQEDWYGFILQRIAPSAHPQVQALCKPLVGQMESLFGMDFEAKAKYYEDLVDLDSLH